MNDLTYALIGPTPICIVAVLLVLGVVYLIARRNEAFYSDHKYPRDDTDFVQARGFKAKCAVALWATEAFLISLMSSTVVAPAATITVAALAALLTAQAVYRNWPDLQSEA